MFDGIIIVSSTLLYPLKFGRMRMKQARLIAVTCWIVCIFISVLPVTKISYFGDAFFGKTGQSSVELAMLNDPNLFIFLNFVR